MNVLLICDKKSRKNYESVLSGFSNYSHIGTETVVKNDIVTNITGYAPHILIWVNGVQFKTKVLDFFSVISDIRMVRPNLRVIYVHSEDKPEVERIASFLMDIHIFDIITDFNKITEIIDSPMVLEDLQEYFQKNDVPNSSDVSIKAEIEELEKEISHIIENDELPDIMGEPNFEIENEIKAEIKTEDDVYPIGFIGERDGGFNFDKITAITY
jgi:hypothetical protein